MKKKVENKWQKAEDEKYFNLVFDEMDIHSDIVINHSTGEVIGYANLTPTEEAMANLESEMLKGKDFQKEPAKKVLVYLAIVVTNDIQEIVAVYTTSGSMTTSQLYTRSWEVVYRMENYGLKVLPFICDGASINKKFLKMHVSWETKYGVIFATRNIACGEKRPIFFIIDPVHVLKSLRNNFANSFSHKLSRKMWKNSQIISWKVIEELFTLILNLKYQQTRLTKAHVKLTAHSCMKVIFATQLMSNSVYECLNYFSPKLADYDLEELKTFIKLVNDWFDCFNGSSETKRITWNELLCPYTTEDDARFSFMSEEVLTFFADWLNDVLTRPGNFSAVEREKMFISSQTYESLRITTYGFIHAVKYMLKIGATSVEPRKFNQDKVEQLFGILRMSFGGNRNPTVGDVLRRTQVLHCAKQAAGPSSKGNTQVHSNEWIPDESPMPRRAKKM